MGGSQESRLNGAPRGLGSVDVRDRQGGLAESLACGVTATLRSCGQALMHALLETNLHRVQRKSNLSILGDFNRSQCWGGFRNHFERSELYRFRISGRLLVWATSHPRFCLGA